MYLHGWTLAAVCGVCAPDAPFEVLVAIYAIHVFGGEIVFGVAVAKVYCVREGYVDL